MKFGEAWEYIADRLCIPYHNGTLYVYILLTRDSRNASCECACGQADKIEHSAERANTQTNIPTKNCPYMGFLLNYISKRTQAAANKI